MALNWCKRNPISSTLGQLCGMLIFDWQNTAAAERWYCWFTVLVMSWWPHSTAPGYFPQYLSDTWFAAWWSDVWRLMRQVCVVSLCSDELPSLTSAAFFSACSSFSWASFSDSEYLSSSSSTPFSFFCRPSSSSSSYRTSAPMNYKYTETEHLRKYEKNIHEEWRESLNKKLVQFPNQHHFYQYSGSQHFTADLTTEQDSVSVLHSHLRTWNSGIGDNTGASIVRSLLFRKEPGVSRNHQQITKHSLKVWSGSFKQPTTSFMIEDFYFSTISKANY